MSESEVELNRTISLVSNGLHIFQITEYEEKVGPKGNYWEYHCKVAEKGPDQGAETLLRISLSPAARWKMNEFLDALKTPITGKTKGSQFLGKVFKGHVVQEENSSNGRVNAVIDSILPYEGPQPTASVPAVAVVGDLQIIENQMVTPFTAPKLSSKEDDIPF